MQIVPYLTFNGNCREAMNFYGEVLGGLVDFTVFSSVHPDMDAESGNKIMHADLRSDALRLMASDTISGNETTFGDDFAVAIVGTDTDALAAHFDKLSAGGQVTLPFSMQAWGAYLGMFTDKYGTHWLVSSE